MNYKTIAAILPAILIIASCGTSSSKKGTDSQDLKVSLVDKSAEKKIDVIIGDKLFTSFFWPENVYKPVLYPVYTSAGTEITRGFPLNPREGESTDHAHHIGIWLNYGDVNGVDFWGNGSTGSLSPRGGVIKHLNVEKMTDGDGEAMIISNESWVDSTGTAMLSERTGYYFSGKGSARIIDRITTLTAIGDTMKFKDTKEGMFGIRVARQLQLPAKEDLTLQEKQGGTTTVKAQAESDITGNYRSSEGITGEEVWGTRAKWMDLYGKIGNEAISITVYDHPDNLSYPTYWHARGYGLFSVNPMGANDFTQGKEQVNFFIPAGKSYTFRYRVIVNSGADLTDAEINAFADEFAAKY
ncbi:MAG: hypothetical protein A2X05_05520 [Bacteroidetes bacterium GWE2_41_25]|nr:MAG: hypothetical protein A2X03_12610 [Bacteroidetes bacterium GWA2_40_15]OFX83763.1 MAG: hypothetical protein A2X06_13380 [Bacteroidetes bacterium GWC2_40_22]OFY03083.1 MAG: hypothetical protein A2X05_05520 [Bacteroidetes bacterium GWE2_41_25]OFY60051.1 MAG: hypothetical protein A2X04_07960 [Bacteroidetes bacterium GWF2_41_9]HAM09217.1 hypothetical protein [Bacteroidales bacterium]